MQKVCHQAVQVPFGILLLVNRVTAVRIDHETKRLVKFNEFVYELFGALIMNIIVSRTVNEQQITLQAVGVRDWGSKAVAFFVVRRQPHETLLIDRVIQALVADKGDGYSDMIDIGSGSAAGAGVLVVK